MIIPQQPSWINPLFGIPTPTYANLEKRIAAIEAAFKILEEPMRAEKRSDGLELRIRNLEQRIQNNETSFVNLRRDFISANESHAKCIAALESDLAALKAKAQPAQKVDPKVAADLDYWVKYTQWASRNNPTAAALKSNEQPETAFDEQKYKDAIKGLVEAHLIVLGKFSELQASVIADKAERAAAECWPKTTSLTFMEAVAAMEAGKKVRRNSWRTGMYVCRDIGEKGYRIVYFYCDGLWSPECGDFTATDWEIIE